MASVMGSAGRPLGEGPNSSAFVPFARGAQMARRVPAPRLPVRAIGNARRLAETPRMITTGVPCGFRRTVGCSQERSYSDIEVLTSLCSQMSLSSLEDSTTTPTSNRVPQQAESFARLYVFDWDNTLCPTDWLCELYARNGMSVYTAKRPCPSLYTSEVRSALNAFENNVRRLLLKCSKRGQVSIMSNATTVGLIKTLKLLPTVHRTLTELSEPAVRTSLLNTNSCTLTPTARRLQ